MRCMLHNHDVYRRATHTLVTQPAGNRVELCDDCLVGWIDSAVEDPSVTARHGSIEVLGAA